MLVVLALLTPAMPRSDPSAPVIAATLGLSNWIEIVAAPGGGGRSLGPSSSSGTSSIASSSAGSTGSSMISVGSGRSTPANCARV